MYLATNLSKKIIAKRAIYHSQVFSIIEIDPDRFCWQPVYITIARSTGINHQKLTKIRKIPKFRGKTLEIGNLEISGKFVQGSLNKQFLPYDVMSPFPNE